METLENLLLAGRGACHHLAVGQTRTCGVCGKEALVAGIDMPQGYQGPYRPSCCRPICQACLPQCGTVIRDTVQQAHSTLTDFQSIVDLAKHRKERALKDGLV